MKFQVTNACNVRAYYRAYVEADTPEEAIAKAKAKQEWESHDYGDDADALEPTYWADEIDETDSYVEGGEQLDEQDDCSYVYKTELRAFVEMLANAVAEHSGLVNDNTGALMTPEGIRRTARHILKMD